MVRELGDLHGCCLMPMGTMGITEIPPGSAGSQPERHLPRSPCAGQQAPGSQWHAAGDGGWHQELFDQQRPLLDHLSQQADAGGSDRQRAATKLALNQLIASLTHAFPLSLRLVQQAGVPVETFMAILRPSALYAPTFDKNCSGCSMVTTATPTSAPLCCARTCACSWRRRPLLDSKSKGLQGLDTLLEQASGGALDASTTAPCMS
ncbi:MAG: hypothetical protein CM15mP116_08560 [Synechococcus sp.]|nr:MAG: hypothetical protein CM15mP116_08560 [Synechococcus sp.]